MKNHEEITLIEIEGFIREYEEPISDMKVEGEE